MFLKQNPRALLQGRYIKVLLSKFFYLLCDVWSGIMFWILFFTAGYWFITYKLQANAYILLPSVDDWTTTYLVFDAIFGLILALRFIAIVMAIVEQASVDIFLIDWEQPPEVALQKVGKGLPKDNIVVWRSIFVANELGEL